ncbi:hypothetical protein EW145_g6231 [Phellinidium pouzarii]|uniref:Fungal-type protein kinase domain-containing protein n=1 Tax=Phellinidium pouzarii TaxID=167371 RepID=A0A4S4KX94_9AGAM|nr:hypothetical protein EW145_g6231 [Phellinidium pouzarii]
MDHIAKGPWTGTLPYMSLDLLPSVSTPPPVHSERFKWESFLYILYWIACHYDKGEYVKCDALDDWLDSDSRTLFKTKNTVLTRPDYRLITAHFVPLAQTWLFPLRQSFSKGYDARAIHEEEEVLFKRGNPSDFDNETLGGHVTYEKVWKVFESDEQRTWPLESNLLKREI